MHRTPQLLQEMKADKVDSFVVTGFPVALAAKAVGVPTVVALGARRAALTVVGWSFGKRL